VMVVLVDAKAASADVPVNGFEAAEKMHISDMNLYVANLEAHTAKMEAETQRIRQRTLDLQIEKEAETQRTRQRTLDLQIEKEAHAAKMEALIAEKHLQTERLKVEIERTRQREQDLQNMKLEYAREASSRKRARSPEQSSSSNVSIFDRLRTARWKPCMRCLSLEIVDMVTDRAVDAGMLNDLAQAYSAARLARKPWARYLRVQHVTWGEKVSRVSCRAQAHKTLCPLSLLWYTSPGYRVAPELRKALQDAIGVAVEPSQPPTEPNNLPERPSL